MSETLQLILFKRWFDQIREGTKTIEYRQVKPYWTRRLFNEDGTVRPYKEILFTNGYGKTRPKMRVEFLGVSERNGNYEIRLGRVLEISNLEK